MLKSNTFNKIISFSLRVTLFVQDMEKVEMVFRAISFLYLIFEPSGDT